jgi:sugar phosphate permease
MWERCRHFYAVTTNTPTFNTHARVILLWKANILCQDTADVKLAGRNMNKNGQLLTFAYVAVFFIGMMFGLESIMPLFFTSLGVSIIDWGILAFLFTLGMLFFEMTWGILSDKFGISKLIAGGLLASAAVTLAYVMPFFLCLFLGLQALRGAFNVMSTPSTRMLISELSSPRNLAFALGLWFSAMRLGSTVGSLVFSYVAQESSYAVAFGSCSTLLFIIGLSALAVLRREEFSGRPETGDIGKLETQGTSTRQALSEISKVNSVYAIFFCAVVGFLQMSMIRTIVPLFASEILGASTFLVGLNQAEFTGFCVVFFLLSGLLEKKVGKKTIVAIGFAALLFSAIAFSMTTDFYQLSVSTILSSFGFSLVAPSLLALLVGSVPRKVLGASVGIYGSIENLGITIAPLLFTLIWSSWGPQYVFYVCGIIQAIGIIFALTLKKPST